MASDAKLLGEYMVVVVFRMSLINLSVFVSDPSSNGQFRTPTPTPQDLLNPFSVCFLKQEWICKV